MRSHNLIALLLIITVITACASPLQSSKPTSEEGSGQGAPGVQTPKNKTGEMRGEGIRTFSSLAELEAYVRENEGGGAVDRYEFVRAAPSVMLADNVAEAMPAAQSGAKDFSGTNVQVQGVDEGDFVKNDGEFLYLLNDDALVIVRAYPPAQAAVVSTTHVPGDPESLFLAEDRVLVVTEDYEKQFTFGQYDYLPLRRSVSRTRALLYDVEDREHPVLLKNWSVSGRASTTRLVGETAYLITQQGLYEYGVINPPVVYEQRRQLLMPEIAYFPSPMRDFRFTTITALDMQSAELAGKTFLTGWESAVYASPHAVYFAYEQEPSWEERSRTRFFEAIVPLLPTSAQREIQRIREQKLSREKEWLAIAEVLRSVYEQLSEEELSELAERSRQAVAEWETKWNLERSSTVIQRIDIDGLKISYGGRGEVRGRLLNQWSMDEYHGWLRVATTLDYWDAVARESVRFNNVYTLDEDLRVRGKLEQLAEDERIYAARFMGDRLYLITFRQIDPLFVIDLSHPRQPRVLGKLKMPGVSQYLHPYDDGHLIGVGKEGDEEGRLGGVKVALYDVTDVAHPKELSSVVLGERGSDSAVLHDHKAFLFSKEKGLMVLPVKEVGARSYDPEKGFYRRSVWQGAYVFHVDESSIEQRGRITHARDEDEDEYYWWRSPWSIRRSLWISSVLYTISEREVKLNDIDSLEELGVVKLPRTEPPEDWGEPIPLRRGIIEE